MSAPMTPEQLAEILARAAAATAGPWCTDSWEIYQGTEYVPGMSFWIGETCRGTAGTAELLQDRADASFVAAARTDVPELVAEVQRLRARVAELETAAAVQALGALPMPTGSREDPHDGPLHTDYATPHDLPRLCPSCQEDEATWCPDCGCCRLGCYGGHEDNSCTHPRAMWATQ